MKYKEPYIELIELMEDIVTSSTPGLREDMSGQGEDILDLGNL